MASMENLPPSVIPGERSAEEDEYIHSGFLNFLHGYTRSEQAGISTSNAGAVKEYELQVQHMQTKDKTTLEVDFMHVRTFDEDLADRIHAEYYKYDKVLRQAVNAFVKNVAPPKDSSVPPDYNVAFFNITEQHKIRDLKSDRIGCLTRITGTVTRTSEVRPELVTGHFKCLECFTEQDPTEQQFKFTQPIICKNPTCAGRRNFHLHIDKSKFVDFQRIRVQENSNEIPAGSMPRSIDVIVRNEQVDRAKPGDKCVFTGTLIVVPDIAQLRAPGERPETVRETGARSGFSSEGVTGLKSLGVRELNYKLCFLAGAVHLADNNGGFSSFRDDGEDGAQEELEPEALRDIKQMSQTPNLYSRLVDSMCPTVFGHDEVKKGILLMLTGGMHKVTKTGTNLRGDINVCVVGDPSTAKSQFLKYVAEFMPRAVYTSGKASSAAGLTASVIRDPETGEFGIEAGALMLADNGICCIDEFDKMDMKDQVAIHEAMEQQTISIAKAGIQATLNARTSILAAANPRDGRYDRSKTLKANVEITAPIMSRFDLFFIILDECNEITDYNIARHIVDVHMHREQVAKVEFSKERLQRYVRYCKGLKPRLTDEAQKKLINYYSELRENDCSGSQRAAYRITVRQLESMVRLSEALAKIHCDPEVKGKYVDEAKRLLKMSIIHVDSPDIGLESDDEDGGDDDGNDAGNNGGKGGGERKDQGPATSPAKSTPGKKKRGRGGSKGAEEEEEEAAKQKEADEETRAAEPKAKKAKKRLEITQEEYEEMTSMITRELRRREDADDAALVVQADLVEWYLGERDDIDSEAGLVEAKRKIIGVIDRLIKIDHTLMQFADDEEEQDWPKSKKAERRRLSVHPNYVTSQ